MAVKKSCKSNCLLFCVLALALMLVFSACRKKSLLQESEGEQLVELVNKEETEAYDFYSPSEDDASWVEPLLAQIEEERIAAELAGMEESLSEYQLEGEGQEQEIAQETESETEPQPEEKNPIELFFEQMREGITLNDKNNEMRFYEFDDEILSPQKTEDGYIIVHSNNKNIIRNFYDKEYKLVKKEEWNIKSAEDAKLLKTEAFVYSKESGSVIQKNITTENTYETISYKASLPVNSKKYAVSDEKNYIILERSWSYDSDNQLIKDEQKEYYYKNNDYSQKTEAFTRRYEYSYHAKVKENENGENEIPPDLKYYENNSLKMQYNYTAQKGSWYCWIYFDANLSVRAYYENEIKVRDDYFNNGNLYRTKLYEKENAAVQGEEQQQVKKQGDK